MSGPVTPISTHGAISHAAPDTRTAKLEHAATEFESLLVKQLLKAAKIGGAGEEKANGYADMAVDALASAIESGGGLGLARRIEEAIGAHALGAAPGPSTANALPSVNAPTKGQRQSAVPPHGTSRITREP